MKKTITFFLACFILNGYSQSKLFVNGGTLTGIGSSTNSFIGIGPSNSSPTSHLHILDSYNGELSLTLQNTFSTGTRTFLTSTPTRSLIQTDRDFGITTNGGGWSEKFTVLNNGNVGIGTTSPATKLDVNGEVRSTWNLRTTSVANGNGYYADDGSGAGAGSTIFSITRQPNNEARFQSYGYHTFYSGGNTGTEKMRIDENGNVGIGTGSPSTKLDVHGEVRSLWNLRTTSVANGNGYYADDGAGSTIFSITRQPNNEARFQSFGYHTFYSGGSTGTEKMRINENGNVGVNHPNPQEKFDVDGTVGIGRMGTSNSSGLKIEYTDGGSGTTVFTHQRWGGDFFFKRMDASNTERTQLYFGGYGNHYMDIYNNNNQVNVRLNTSGDSFFNGGNVGIGTTNPTKKLTVKGTVYSTEVKVDINAGADYVFENNYSLLSLDSIKTYIDQYKHLPEVPSAKEMETNGVNLGEMNIVLLKKIEELTLYVIEVNKKMEELRNENHSSNTQIKLLQKETNQLKK